MKIHQAGFDSVVGLFGDSLSEAQEDLLAAYFSNVVIMLGGDVRGRRLAESITSRVARRAYVRIVDRPDNKTPAMLPGVDLRELLLS
jgi:DNA primase